MMGGSYEGWERRMGHVQSWSDKGVVTIWILL